MEIRSELPSPQEPIWISGVNERHSSLSRRNGFVSISVSEPSAVIKMALRIRTRNIYSTRVGGFVAQWISSKQIITKPQRSVPVRGGEGKQTVGIWCWIPDRFLEFPISDPLVIQFNFLGRLSPHIKSFCSRVLCVSLVA